MRLLKAKGVCFSKNKADAFNNPSLMKYLNNHGIHELIVKAESRKEKDLIQQMNEESGLYY